MPGPPTRRGPAPNRLRPNDNDNINKKINGQNEPACLGNIGVDNGYTIRIAPGCLMMSICSGKLRQRRKSLSADDEWQCLLGGSQASQVVR